MSAVNLCAGRLTLLLKNFLNDSKDVRKEYVHFVRAEIEETYLWLRETGFDEEKSLAVTYQAVYLVFHTEFARNALRDFFVSQNKEALFNVLEASAELAS